MGVIMRNNTSSTTTNHSYLCICLSVVHTNGFSINIMRVSGKSGTNITCPNRPESMTRWQVLWNTSTSLRQCNTACTFFKLVDLELGTRHEAHIIHRLLLLWSRWIQILMLDGFWHIEVSTDFRLLEQSNLAQADKIVRQPVDQNTLKQSVEESTMKQ